MTNSRPFASAYSRLSPALEKRQDSAQRVAQIEQHPAAEQLRRAVGGRIRAAKHRIIGSAFFAQMAARAGDGVSLVVEQALDAEDHVHIFLAINAAPRLIFRGQQQDRKSTRLNSSHSQISYAVFCLKKKKKKHD